MTGNQNQFKHSINKGVNEILQHYQILSDENGYQNLSETGDTCLNQQIENETVISKNVAKCVKYFIENSLGSVMNDHLNLIENTNKETWKIEAHNLTKSLLEHSKVVCLQDNITNILDTCLNEVQSPKVKYHNDSELDISPLLQPGHITEIAECMSADKPTDVRLSALQVLFKSHFSEAVNRDSWLLLQKKLVESLCDSNLEIFITCLRAHGKLASSSSPTALKECALNLLESLGQHYYHFQNDDKTVSLQSMHFYRVMNICRLLLDLFREATLNIARFGENRLEEIIDNFLQLLAISVHSKQSRNKHFTSPLAIISYLDPYGNWLVNLTHFTMSRKLFFSSLCKNNGFLALTVEEVVRWLSEPVIPSINISKVTQGEIAIDVHKFSVFCHSLSVFVGVCSFGISHILFPIKTNMIENLLTKNDIVKMIIVLLNEKKFNEIISMSTDVLRNFIAQNVSKLLCMKEVNGSLFLLMLLKQNDSQEVLTNILKVKILDFVSQSISSNNPFLTNQTMSKRKTCTFSHCFITKTNGSTNQETKPKHELERQTSLHLQLNSENNLDIYPFEIYLNHMKNLQIGDLKNNPCLVQIMTRVLRNFDRWLGLNLALKNLIIQFMVEIYKKLQENLIATEHLFDSKEIALSNCITEFLLQASISPVVFYVLEELKVVADIVSEMLQQPIIEWSDPVWLLFISKSANTNDGCEILTQKSSEILRKEIHLLWNIIEEDCSGSDLPIEEAAFKLLNIVSSLGFNLLGTKAVLSESRDGSEITLTDDSDLRPSNLSSVIEDFALSSVNCIDFVYRQFALTVLETVVSNIDSCIYLQHRFKFQDILLVDQSYNRLDEHSEVIIDECSILRHKIIEQAYLPGRYRANSKPTHLAPRPESTLARAKPRSRGNGELARWLSETKLGLHDHNWLKHARKLYRISCLDDIKGSTMQDLLEQVVKVLPECRAPILWMNTGVAGMFLEPEEQLAVQLVMRYGSHHRLIQSTQQNADNLSQLFLLTKGSLRSNTSGFNGFDWFVASAYLLCSGNVEKSQAFLTLVSTLPAAPLMWPFLGEPLFFGQFGCILETIVSEEMPAVYLSLQNVGISWWQLCETWISQCWWNVLDWPQICHWFILCILYQTDHLVYFCVSLLNANQDRILRMAREGTTHNLIRHPLEKFQLTEARILIDKLHKKYHSSLNTYLTLL